METKVESKKFRFYHFIKAEYVEEFLLTGLLKVTQLGYSNDYFEFMPAFSRFEDEKTWNKSMQQAAPCVICLSTRMSSTPMWGHYGAQGKGVCLVFDLPIAKVVSPFIKNESSNSEIFPYLISGIEIPMVKVHYTNERYRLNTIPQMNSNEMNQALIKLVCRKALDWQYEQEYRVIIPERDLKTKKGYLFYSGLHQYCSAVLLGWNCSYTRLYLESVLKQCFKKDIWILNMYPSKDKFEFCVHNLNGEKYNDTDSKSIEEWIYN